jgi:hypothetical protein
MSVYHSIWSVEEFEVSRQQHGALVISPVLTANIRQQPNVSKEGAMVESWRNCAARSSALPNKCTTHVQRHFLFLEQP